MPYLEVAILLLLIVANGFLALSELAIVSSRRARLERMAQEGRSGARVALQLAADHGRFLSAVQIGITLVGIVAGAFGGAAFASRIGRWLDSFPGIAPHGQEIGYVVTVVAVTYLTLVIGELVPKRIALANPERIAIRVARPMKLLAQAAAPVVWLLKESTDLVLAALGLKGHKRQAVTEEELKSMLAEGTRAGVFVPEERAMIEGVLRLADREVRSVMTPRQKLFWVDLNDPADTVLAELSRTPHSRVLVCDGSVDRPVGVLHMKHLPPAASDRATFDLKDLMVPPIMTPEGTPVLQLLERFREEGVHMAVIIDEYGMTEGIVTPTDILESIAGDLPERGETIEPMLVQRADGSWLADGRVPLDEFADRTGIRDLTAESRFHTLAGFVLDRMGRLPQAGDAVEHRSARYEVVDMDGRRIDKIAVYPITPPD